MSEQTQSDVVVDSSPQVEVVEPIEAEAVETEVESESAPKEVEAKEAEKEHDESSLPEGVKKRIDKVTRQKYEAIAEANRLRAELEQLRAQFAPKQEVPDISQFDTMDDYVEALVEYKYQNNMLSQQEKYAERAREQRVAREWTDKVEKVRAVAPDFDEAFANVAEITFAQSTLDAVAGHEKGAEIAYLLGKDPVKAYQIASLPPIQQLMAIGEIAAKTNLTRPKTVTNAPPPVKPISGKSSIVDPNSLSTKEWVEYRNKQLRQK